MTIIDKTDLVKKGKVDKTDGSFNAVIKAHPGFWVGRVFKGPGGLEINTCHCSWWESVNKVSAVDSLWTKERAQGEAK